MTIGKSDAKVFCEMEGGELPVFTLPERKIRKIGIDQNLINPTNADDARWLRALIWPDQLERFVAMDAALKINDLRNIEFVKASDISDFECIISSVPKDELLIVYCTHTMYQFPIEFKTAFWEMLDRVGKARDFYFLSAEDIRSQLEKYKTENTVIELSTYCKGLKTQTWMAEANSHGKWLIWHG
jgi:hypothetical protein